MGKARCAGGQRETKIFVTRAMCAEFPRRRLLVPGDENVPFLLVPKEHRLHGSFISCFWEEKGEVRTLILYLLFFQRL